MIVAIDGPAATGKSTSARHVAQRLGFTFLDTGAMYRCVNLDVLRHNIDLSNTIVLEQILSNLKIEFGKDSADSVVFLNGEDVSKEIRQDDVTNNVSVVSAHALVRKSLVRIQRQITANQNCVLEGRDIGTIVFPDADVKFFLVADDRVRAKRRQLELDALGEKKSIDALINDIRKRDKLDSERDHSPLKKANDAIELDTTQLTFDEQVDFIVNKVKSIITGN